jgi:hypothetical protein
MLLTTFLLLVSQAQPWRVDRTVDGMKVELREVPGSKFEEVRVSTTSSASLSSLCDAVWGKGLQNKKPEGEFKKRVLIKETADERWTYEQIRVPVVADRDYVIHTRRLADASTGRCEVSFDSCTDPMFPPLPDHVRIPSIRGAWKLVPNKAGRVDVSYVVHSEPGGSIPALLARGGQRDAAVGFLKVILARAQAGAR